MDASASNPPRTPLSCSKLRLPEQILIWLVRTAVNKGVTSCDGTLRKLVGVGSLPRALVALASLRQAAHECPLDVAPILPLDEPTLSPEEADLITGVAAAQAFRLVSPLTERWGWPPHEHLNDVEHAVLELGGLLSHAGKRVTVSSTRSLLAAQGVMEVSGLDYRERTIVLAVRRWVEASRANDDDPRAAVAEALHPIRLGGGVMSLDAILRNTSLAATRYVTVNCPGCASLAEDEARLLHATSAVQRPGNEGIALRLLADWLKPGAVRLTMTALTGLARALIAEQHRLPFRYWCFPELNSANANTNVIAATPTLISLH